MPKTWTATDVKVDQITFRVVGATLIVIGSYVFLDDQGELLVGMRGREHSEEAEISEVPQNVLSALQEVRNWLRNKIIDIEGI